MNASESKLSKALLEKKSVFVHQPVTVPPAGVFDLPEKVLQFGTGVLLRGLPDFFIDKANQQGLFNGRVVVVKSTDSGSADVFGEQDNLFTLCIRGLEKGKPIEEYRINSAISRTLSARSDWASVLACAQQPDLQIIISNTTEVGIQLVEDNVLAMPPVSFPGKLTAFLHERFRAFNGTADSGMIIIPCELVVDNGRLLKEMVLEQAKRNQLGADFIIWVEKYNTFCNSLVDRIVPGKPDREETQKLFGQLGYQDELLTVAEVYRLWAIEGDKRVQEILSFGKADPGVIITPDITPYRERKLRLLNGVHTISVGLGYLYGLETVGDCLNDSRMSHFITNVALQEIVPAVPVDEESAITFAEDVLDRFRNPFIVHPLINITLQYTSKMKMRNVQSLLNYYQKYNVPPPHFSLGFAAYLLFMRAVKEEEGKYYGERNGQSYPINDQYAAYFYGQWQSFKDEEAGSFVENILRDTSLWGTDLSTLPDFSATVTKHLLNLLGQGVVHTLQAYTHAAL